LHEAIESGELPVYREQGSAVRDHVAAERRHVARTDLRDWIAKHYPDQRPPTLFDATERATHSAINADAFRALQADRDAARSDLERMAKVAKDTFQKYSELQHERDSLAAMVEKNKPLDPRERSTLLIIIAALAKEAKINIDSPGKAALSIEGLTDSMGAHTSRRAIEDHLKNIPYALATRMK
jgi:hypothetical protein